MLGTTLGYVNGITLEIDVGIELGSLDGSFDDSNYGKLEGILILDSLGSDDGKVLGTILGYLYVITLELDVGTDLGSFDRYFDDSSYNKIEGLLLI